jgi:hypothetical protein
MNKTMPDITMCPGTNCPFKESCYRFTAKPNEYQSYFIEPPFKGDDCKMYWGDNAEMILKQLKDIMKDESEANI